ncbi:hypothetical protein LCM17_23230 [Cereibacter sphaeroides]|nr:hypothetical protein [Cereibacter sphaeroides]
MRSVLRPFSRSILLGLFLASPALAQVGGAPVVIPAAAGATNATTVSPFAGEHATFTRVVLRLPAGSEWAITPEGRDRRVSVQGVDTRFDVSRLFDRIPRARLTGARDDSGDLLLTMGCDCTIRAWEERPGLLVLDISGTPDATAARTPVVVPATPIVIPGTPEPLTEAESAAVEPEPAPVPRRPVTLPRPNIDPIAAGRAAGAALARLMPPTEEAPAPPPEDDPRLQTLAEDLGRTVAAALGQGLLEPSADHNPGALGLLNGTETPEMPANMRVSTVMDRPNPEAMPEQPLPPICVGGAELSSLMTKDVNNFAAEFGRLSSELYGEFDQPNPQARAELVGLYLAAGFGAEARALLQNAADPVAVRDLAMGVADVLEDRASNSRMRLAQAIDCGGTVSVMAALAGAPEDRVRAQADRLALAFVNMPANLRDLTGLPLAQALADIGAMDAARIVADALHRSEWVNPEALALVEARLDRARGLPGAAAARLAQEGGHDPETVQTRLDLALQTNGSMDPAYLDDVEAIAAGARSEESGPELMASVIRLHARSGALPDAFQALDRLESWMSETGENLRILSDLRDTVWDALATNGTDFGLIEAVLAREDWRDGGLTEDTRRKLARRLLDLGFATPVEDLIGNLEDNDARVTRARAYLEQNDPRTALSMIDGLMGVEARQTRAAAMERLGNHAGAAAEFAALGITDSAARAAIAGGDWRRVETLRNEGVLPPAAADLGQMLGRAPGHAEIAIERAAEEAARAPAEEHAAPAHAPAPAHSPAPAAPATAHEPAAQAAPDHAPTAPAAQAHDVPMAQAPAADHTPAPVAHGDTNAQPAEAIAQAGRDAPQDHGATPAEAGHGDPHATATEEVIAQFVPAEPLPDAGAEYDRLGLVRRSSTLLAESERLRDALAPLMISSE